MGHAVRCWSVMSSLNGIYLVCAACVAVLGCRLGAACVAVLGCRLGLFKPTAACCRSHARAGPEVGNLHGSEDVL